MFCKQTHSSQPLITGCAVVVLPEWGMRGWLVGVEKRAPRGFRCPCLVSPRGSLDRLNGLLFALFPFSLEDTKGQT